MVLLEIATLIMAGVGLADYYHTKIYKTHLNELKRKYGEHPNIDEAFEDICTLGGEYFKMPELILNPKNPHIDMGSYYPYITKGPKQVLKEFFVTNDELKYFDKKYEQEVARQARLRDNKLERMYEKILPLYRNNELQKMGSTKMDNQIFQTPSMSAWNENVYRKILNDICKNTIWGEIIEAGPNIYGGQIKYLSEWFIKEDIFKEIQNKEVYNLIFECCYYNSKFHHI